MKYSFFVCAAIHSCKHSWYVWLYYIIIIECALDACTTKCVHTIKSLFKWINIIIWVRAYRLIESETRASQNDLPKKKWRWRLMICIISCVFVMENWFNLGVCVCLHVCVRSAFMYIFSDVDIMLPLSTYTCHWDKSHIALAGEKIPFDWIVLPLIDDSTVTVYESKLWSF